MRKYFYSRNELRKFKQYRKDFEAQGFPHYEAEYRAYNLLYVRRKADVHLPTLKPMRAK